MQLANFANAQVWGTSWAINGYKMNLMAILFKNSSSYEQMYFAEAAHLLFSKVTLWSRGRFPIPNG